MKRFIALLISFMVLLCGCAENDNISSPNQENSQNESSQLDLEPTPNEPIEEIRDVVVSKGKPYTVSTKAADEYSDTYLSELTNGESAEDIYSFTNLSLAGYATRKLDIVIDLEKVYDNIHTFQCCYYLDNTAGISSLLKITVSYSENNADWTSIGPLDDPSVPKLKNLNVSKKSLEDPITARYIKFTVIGNLYWIFLEELSVIASTTEENPPSYGQLIEAAYNKLGTIPLPQNGNPIDKSLPKVCISRDAKYSTDAIAIYRFGDSTCKMLTDGKSGSIFEDQTWVGYQGGKDIKIKIILDEASDNIASIEVNCLSKEDMNIILPTAVSFTAIDANQNRQDIGIVYGNPDIHQGKYTFTLSLPKAISAKYIEVTLHTADSAIHFLDEISVYAFGDKNDDFLYPEVVIDNNVTDWENPSSEYRNLVLNKPCQISVDVNPPKSTFDNNSKVTEPMLTDGIFSTNYNIHNGKFFKFNASEKRTIIFDLEHLSAVDKFTIGFCHIEGWSVYAPKVVNVTVSDDGENWYKIGVIAPKETNYTGIMRGELLLEEKIKARYVAFSFDIIIWAGIDEIQIFGTENIQNAISPDKNEAVYATQVVKKRKEPSPDLLKGAKDLCLLYHSNYNPGYTVDNLIPYLAYVDENNIPQDVMFDSFLFLHDTGSMPSGGSAFKDSTMRDWQWCIDDLFVNGENLYALEEAAGQIKTALNLGEDYKYKVTMTVYYPTASMTAFGDVDGDGISENFSIYQDRIKAFKWYIQQIEERFSQAGFKNIELVGYYWWHEGIDGNESDSQQMLNELADIIHSVGKDFFWIPWFCAPGFSAWDSYGFDIACMQPNYVFNSQTPYSNLTTNERLTEHYGMGFEMEIFEECLNNKVFFKKYMEYITLGAEAGYMNDTVNMYYQSFLVFNQAAYSDNLMARTVYDTTYHYIKGDLKNIPDSLESMSFEIEKNKIFFGDLGFDSDKLREFEVYTLPDHGTVSLTDDGGFYYFPEKDYVGEVKFSIVYSEYLSWSEPCEIVLNIS